MHNVCVDGKGEARGQLPGLPALHSQQLQGAGVTKRELPSLFLQRVSVHQVATGGQPAFSIPGRKRASELMADQATPKETATKEAAAG